MPVCFDVGVFVVVVAVVIVIAVEFQPCAFFGLSKPEVSLPEPGVAVPAPRLRPSPDPSSLPRRGLDPRGKPPYPKRRRVVKTHSIPAPPCLFRARRLFLRSLDVDGKGFFSRETAIEGLRRLRPLLEESADSFGNPSLSTAKVAKVACLVPPELRVLEPHVRLKRCLVCLWVHVISFARLSPHHLCRQRLGAREVFSAAAWRRELRAAPKRKAECLSGGDCGHMLTMLHTKHPIY